MRILVTPVGIEEIESLRKARKTRGPKDYSKSKSRSKSKSPLFRDNSLLEKSRKNRMDGNKTGGFSHYSPETTKLKEINIKQRKLLSPKNMTEKYINDTSQTTTFILPTLNLATKNVEKETIDSNVVGQNKYKLKEILNEDSYKNIVNNREKEEKMKDRLSRIDEKKFRSNYANKTFLQKFDEKLTTSIDPDKLNLLKYLNEKKDIGEKFLSKIVNYNDEKINRINKICQIVFYEEEHNQLMKGIIKEKLKIYNNKVKIDYRGGIDSMAKNIEDLSSLLRNYEKIDNKRDRYKDVHNDMLKYWKNNNIDKFTRKGKIPFHNNTSINQSADDGRLNQSKAKNLNFYNMSKFINNDSIYYD
jgi:hypothetical protein